MADNRMVLTVKTPSLFQSPELYKRKPSAAQIQQGIKQAEQLITQMLLSLY